MPKTSLFETDLYIVKEYLDNNYGEEYDTEYDEKEIITPNMAFTMNYMHTKNYASEDATIIVNVVSIRTIIDDEYSGIHVLGCVLKTEIPIFVCARGAYLARPITLHTENGTIAKGHVTHFIS
jgi:hypothetical protein